MGQSKSGRKMLYPQLAGVKWCPGEGKAAEVETVPGGLIMPEGWQTEEIRVEDPIEPDFFLKNQAGKTTPKAG